jgi:CMP-N,N'-diacetyllegionaminic acid synthase
MRHLALIRARAGSTGIPGKNMVDLGGKPLVQWTIECAKSAGVFDAIVVYSDWLEVRQLAERMGVLAMDRPLSLSGDHADVADQYRNVLEQLPQSDVPYDTICLLNPTSPFRTAADIRESYEIYKRIHPQGVVSVEPFKPLIMTRLRRGKRYMWHQAGRLPSSRQKRKPMYKQNGAIYITDLRYFWDSGRWLGDKVAVLPMSKHRSFDIDDWVDLLAARALVSEILTLEAKEPTSEARQEAASSPVAGAVLPGN